MMVRSVALVVAVAVMLAARIVDTRAMPKAAGCYSYSSHYSFHWDETVK